MPDELSLKIDNTDAGQRLDLFVHQHLQDVSRSQLRKWIDDGQVLVDGESVKAGYRLRVGEVVRVDPPEPAPLELIPEPIPLQIIHEDQWLVVIDKPAGLVVHPGAGNRSGTLANALLHHFREVSRQQSERPGLVHRLDKFTSGLLLVAKDERTHASLAAQFKQRTVDKAYAALVHGVVKQDRGRIEAPIGRHPRHRKRFSTAVREGRTALTEYLVTRRFQEFSLLEVKLHTGRTHQIRVHMLHEGHPVVGDELYGPKSINNVRESRMRLAVRRLGRHFLHAEQLSFEHPVTRERLNFVAPLPAELAEFLRYLE